MEKLELYDENNNPTGIVINRGEKNFSDNLKIKLVTVWFENNGKFLVQKCSVKKGGEIAITGGHVPFGVSSMVQAIVEVEEELGIKLEKHDLNFLGDFTIPKAIFDVYVCKKNIIVDKSKLQKEEVEDVFWVTKDEIQEFIKNGIFRKSSQIQFQKFFDN